MLPPDEAYAASPLASAATSAAVPKGPPTVGTARAVGYRTTLPDDVVALAEEAVRFYARKPTVSALGAKLALRTVAYMADKEEAHVHWRWGKGSRPGWYGGTEQRERSLVEHARLGLLGAKGREY